ncbi:protein root UVB sensitive 4-like isoform X1 [Primulina tabacum]|uniref:protein root UVB sensitive 4-like isoform X1 n=1 Tax=Primulina tabacum TaxID=48773 RepID=UPI003F593EB5
MNHLLNHTMFILMEATIQIHPNSRPHHCKWNPPHSLNMPSPKIPKPTIPKTSLKSLILPKTSLTTSFSCSHDFHENFHSCRLNDEVPETLDFPFVVRHSGTVSRYVWDRREQKLVSVNGINGFRFWDFFIDYEDGVRKLGRFCWSAVRNFFLPREVSENYLEYVKWKFLHRVFSSALQVLATQAMFRAIGFGYSRSLPSAAALNWVLKDGLGRLSRCIYTASLASAFDTNLKRVRFTTSVLFSLSIGVELLTPIFPDNFLLLATMANIAKQISLACHLATGSAVHRSFASSDNLGEVSAKSQIQTVCFDNIGLLLAAALNITFKNNKRLLAALPFVAYPIFSTVDLFGIYQGLKHVHLQTLTKDRLELIIKTWIELGDVPSPAQVSKMEGVGFFRNSGMEMLPIRIGCLNLKRIIPRLSIKTMRSLSNDDFYFIYLESLNHGFRLRDLGIVVCLREGAATSDVIMGLLQACYIRKGLHVVDWENVSEACDSSNSVIEKWSTLMEESKKSSRNNLDLLNENMLGAGWACRNVLLSTQEQARYSFVTD